MQLISEIISKVSSIQVKDLKNKTRKDIERVAAGLGISSSVTEEIMKSRGWEVQAKGLV